MKKARQVRKEKAQLPHPRDRKVRQLERKEHRLKKLEKRKQFQEEARIQRALRFLWFRTQCFALEYKTVVPSDDVPVLIQLYIDRHEDELRHLKSLKNPPAGRIKEINALSREEQEAFMSSGFEIPILTTSDDFDILTEIWDGCPETASVLTTEFVRAPCIGICEERKRELKDRLASLDEIRMNAAAVLPRRFAKKAIKNMNCVKEKKSVKKMDSSKEVQQRTVAKHKAKSEKKRKMEVDATLSKMRAEK